jgi:hypothetical protein
MNEGFNCLADCFSLENGLFADAVVDLQAIADRFQTSPSTVRKQREHISEKFGVQGEQNECRGN